MLVSSCIPCVVLKGYPRLIAGDTMNWSTYVPGKPSALPSKVSPRVNTKQTYLPFLRSIYDADVCVLKVFYVCPHTIMRVSLCHHVCVLMLSCVCPHAFMRVSLSLNKCSLIHIQQGRYRTTRRSTSCAIWVYTQSIRTWQRNTQITIITCRFCIHIGSSTARPRGTTNIMPWQDKSSYTFSMRGQNSKVWFCYVFRSIFSNFTWCVLIFWCMCPHAL